jgi:hypothetical protein
MAFKISRLKDLTINKHDNGINYVYFSDFATFLKTNRQPSESQIRNSNVFSWLKGKDHAVQQINGQPAFRVNNILHFCFAHSNQFEVCRQITNEIQLCITTCDTGMKANVNTVLNIYQKVSKESFLDKEFTDKVLIEESSLETLNTHYKDEFTSTEWHRICFFEHHFQRSHSIDLASETYDSLLSRKSLFLENLKKTNDISDLMIKIAQREIFNRLKRKEIAETNQRVYVLGKFRHSPLMLELDITESLPDSSLITTIVCVDCTQSCSNGPGIHAYIELSDDCADSFSDITTIISHFLEKRHKEVFCEIVFFRCGSLNQYNNFEGGLSRFGIRDDFLTGKLQDQVLHVWKNFGREDVYFEDVRNCDICCLEKFMKPLSMNTFDVIQGWYIETPLVIQLLFEGYINRSSMRRTDDKQSFLAKKFKRLYCQYDTLLNSLNRCYFGIIQDMNTQELILNYHSISAVFNLTSSSGITFGIRTAEDKVKELTHSEKTYYNTYLRKYPMTYLSAVGEKMDCISLRDCVLILMMDNLVRLKKRADPDPGESRSMQLCTLPITIKGIPRDSSEVDSWHINECDQIDDLCECKKDAQFKRDEVDSLLLTLSDQQNLLLINCQKLFSFGFRVLWRQIFSGKTIVVYIQRTFLM